MNFIYGYNKDSTKFTDFITSIENDDDEFDREVTETSYYVATTYDDYYFHLYIKEVILDYTPR